jgi:hypothetical protein
MPLTIADAELMMLSIRGEGCIVADPAIQQRVALDHEKIHDYAELYADGRDLGRLVVFQTDEGWLLADGFHRHGAAFMAGLAELPCAVYQGSRREALLYATSCNLHGKPLTNADKRKRVKTLLTDPEWAQWSDNSIAKHCGVAHSFVSKIRQFLSRDSEASEDTTSPSLDSESSDNGIDASLHSEISENGTSPTKRTYTNRYGQVRTMETGAIGREPVPEVLVLEPEADEGDATVPTTLEQTSTGDFEWYTPREVLALVRAVLGTIDVDPASCAEAQATVQACTYYTLADDGVRQPWHGTVFCNPPYKMPEIARFVGKLLEEQTAGHLTEAILLVNAATETDWFQRAFARSDAVCFPDGRIHFVSSTRNGDHPCQGQAILYFGPHGERFAGVFAALGVSTWGGCVRTTPRAQLPLTEAPAVVADPIPAPAEAPTRLRDQVGLQQAVLQTVKQLQPCTNSQVRQALGEQRQVTHQALQALVKHGKVVKEGETYRVVDAPAPTGL